MLARWRADVSRWLSEQDAAAQISPEFREHVKLAWYFLTRHGYINFGVSEDIRGRKLERGEYFSPKTIVVVGAGLAGGFHSITLNCRIVLYTRVRDNGKILHPSCFFG